jgi:hypothetical protein
LEAVLAGFKAARTAEIEGHTYLARLAIGLSRWPKDKYLPSLEQLLEPARPKGKQSVDDMLAAFQDMKDSGAPIKITKVS